MNFNSIDIMSYDDIQREYDNIIEQDNSNFIAEDELQWAGAGGCAPCVRGDVYDYQCSWAFNRSTGVVYVICPTLGTGFTVGGTCYYGMCNAVGATCGNSKVPCNQPNNN